MREMSTQFDESVWYATRLHPFGNTGHLYRKLKKWLLRF